VDAAKAEILQHYVPRVEGPEEVLHWKEYEQYIREILNALPPQTRTIFKLLREENRSYNEVAELLGISRNAVKKHVMRFNKTFRDSLGMDDAPIVILLYIMPLFKNL
jgi:RNA polymerase sigma-70 factor (ECF subfamily)